jgi:hypothetical protein
VTSIIISCRFIVCRTEYSSRLRTKLYGQAPRIYRLKGPVRSSSSHAYRTDQGDVAMQQLLPYSAAHWGMHGQDSRLSQAKYAYDQDMHEDLRQSKPNHALSLRVRGTLNSRQVFVRIYHPRCTNSRRRRLYTPPHIWLHI